MFLEGARGRNFFGITDGTSNTILIVEAQQAVRWTQPEFLPYYDDQPLPALGGLHTSGFNALLADGSARFFRSSMSEKKLKAWITADGGEIVNDD